MPSLHRRIAQVLQAQESTLRGQRIVAGVSGGADSVALLCLLCDLSEELGYTVTAAHLEHGIRGAASRRDAEFVQALCESRGVVLQVAHVDVPDLAKKRGKGLEEAARHARYSFLESVRAEVEAAYILVAHHQEDQAETVLLHLARGAGLAGLCGMSLRSGRILRPLLGERKETLVAYLRSIGQSWREDASNRDAKHLRNAVRRELLPVLERLNPAVVPALGRMTSVLSEDEAYLQSELLARAWPSPIAMPYGYCLRVQGLQEAPVPLLRRHLQRAIRAMGLEDLDFAHLLALEQLVRTPKGSLSLPQGVTVHRGDLFLHVLWQGRPLREEREIPLCSSGSMALWLGLRMMVRRAMPGETGDGITTQALPESALRGAVLRARKPADRFAPMGAGGSQKLKQTLVDEKIDRYFRGFVPLIAKGSEILWIPGRRAAQGAAVSAQGGERAVLLEVEGNIPWARI